MENILLLAVFVTLLFCFAKFIEMKYLDKEFKPLKIIVRDALIVFVSTVVASFVSFNMSGTMTDFFNVVTENKTLNMEATQIFTDIPSF